MWRVLAAACVLVACSPAPEKKAEAPAVAESIPVTSVGALLAPTAPWSCADGQGFALSVYGNPDYAELVFPDGAKLHLAQAVAASGTLYEDASHSFHSKGDEALLIENGKTTTCRAATGGLK